MVLNAPVPGHCLPFTFFNLSAGGPRGRVGKVALYLSALNHSIISPLCLV